MLTAPKWFPPYSVFSHWNSPVYLRLVNNANFLFREKPLTQFSACCWLCVVRNRYIRKKNIKESSLEKYELWGNTLILCNNDKNLELFLKLFGHRNGCSLGVLVILFKPKYLECWSSNPYEKCQWKFSWREVQKTVRNIQKTSLEKNPDIYFIQLLIIFWRRWKNITSTKFLESPNQFWDLEK